MYRIFLFVTFLYSLFQTLMWEKYKYFNISTLFVYHSFETLFTFMLDVMVTFYFCTLLITTKISYKSLRSTSRPTSKEQQAVSCKYGNPASWHHLIITLSSHN